MRLALVLGLGFSLPVSAATVVIPNANATTAGNFANEALLRSAPRTVQIVFAAAQFSQVRFGSQITGMSVRLSPFDLSWPIATRTWNAYDIQVSRSNFAPGSLNSSFANNIGSDVVSARTGSLTIATGAFSGGSPVNAFSFFIPFTTPYVYMGGDLLVTVRHTGNGVDEQFLDSVTNNQTGQILAAGGYTALVDGGLAASFPIIQFTYSPQPLRFVPVTPCRVADTRNTAGPFGGPAVAGQTTRSFVIPSSACNIPTSAQAYSFNVAVVPQGQLGYLTVWPTGQAQPFVATLNSDGRIKSNAAIVPAGANGAVSFFASNTTDVVIDINGYFVPSTTPSALAFYPLTPCRIADTRNANGALGGPFLAGQRSRTFPIQSSSCGIPGSAQAYSVNFAAVPRAPSLGYLTAWPTGQSQPFVASLNAPTGTVTANAAVVPAGANGSFDVFASNDTDLVIDINGYFAPPSPTGLAFYGLAPCRVLDSRLPLGTQPFSGTLSVPVTAGACGAPPESQAFVFNATVVPPGALGFLTLWPENTAQPLVATLNASDGAITGNMAIVPTINGSISAFPSNPTHLVMDMFGYFAP